jgi:hypothetical protein
VVVVDFGDHPSRQSIRGVIIHEWSDHSRGLSALEEWSAPRLDSIDRSRLAKGPGIIMKIHHGFLWAAAGLTFLAAPWPSHASLVVERSGSLAATKTVQAGVNSGPLQSQGLLGAPIGSIQLDKFDDMGGLRQLTGVSVVVSGEVRNEGHFHFISPNTVIGVNVQASDVQVRLLPGGPVFKVPLAFEQSTYESTSPTDSARPWAPRKVDLPLTHREGFAADASEENPFQFSEPEDLAAFVGPGTFDVPVFASALASFASSTGNGKAVINTFAGARVRVRYQYRDQTIAVPEPASLLMVLVGASGLAAFARVRHLRRAV